MAIKTTYVIGGPQSVSDAVTAKLPGAKRLGGPDVASTAVAVNNEVKGRGLPTNIAYVADDARPVDAAVAAAAVARIGGMVLLSPGAATAGAEKQIDQLGLTGAVDKVVVVRSTSSTSPPWALIVISALLATFGVLLLGLARRGASAGAPATRASTGRTPGRSQGR